MSKMYVGKKASDTDRRKNLCPYSSYSVRGPELLGCQFFAGYLHSSCALPNSQNRLSLNAAVVGIFYYIEKSKLK